jgi:hypothetical protein
MELVLQALVVRIPNELRHTHPGERETNACAATMADEKSQKEVEEDIVK